MDKLANREKRQHDRKVDEEERMERRKSHIDMLHLIRLDRLASTRLVQSFAQPGHSDHFLTDRCSTGLGAKCDVGFEKAKYFGKFRNLAIFSPSNEHEESVPISRECAQAERRQMAKVGMDRG